MRLYCLLLWCIGMADLVVTAHGLSQDILSEWNPMLGAIFDRWGLVGFIVAKTAIHSAFVIGLSYALPWGIANHALAAARAILYCRSAVVLYLAIVVYAYGAVVLCTPLGKKIVRVLPFFVWHLTQ